MLQGFLDSGTEVAPGVGSDIAKEGSTELAYSGSPIAAALSLFDGIDEVAAGLGRITCPVLLLSSRQDHVVPSSSGDCSSPESGAPSSGCGSSAVTTWPRSTTTQRSSWRGRWSSWARY